MTDDKQINQTKSQFCLAFVPVSVQPALMASLAEAASRFIQHPIKYLEHP
jgi:hypothetical protein